MAIPLWFADWRVDRSLLKFGIASDEAQINTKHIKAACATRHSNSILVVFFVTNSAEAGNTGKEEWQAHILQIVCAFHLMKSANDAM
jgi:hypothetical protein